MADKSTVSVMIGGKEFRLRSDEDAESLQRVAGYLDETMRTVEARTGTIDSRDLALLTGLNLARELVRIRDSGASEAAAPASERLEALTDLVEAELAAPLDAPA
jgi:cell division protein ZapA (FtsZ GTPase activity inhibitor)